MTTEDDLRIEVARLGAMVNELRDALGYVAVATDHQNKPSEGPTCHICNRVDKALSIEPPTALRELLQPTIKLLVDCDEIFDNEWQSDSLIRKRIKSELTRLRSITSPTDKL